MSHTRIVQRRKKAKGRTQKGTRPKKTTQTQKAQQETNKNKHKTTQNKGNGAGQKEWELAEGTKGAMGKKSTRRKMDKVRKEQKKKKQCTNDVKKQTEIFLKGRRIKGFSVFCRIKTSRQMRISAQRFLSQHGRRKELYADV